MEKIKLIPYLINNSYGGFHFSKLFQDLYFERFNVKPSENDRLNPNVVNLFKELGTEKSSGRSCVIGIEWVPEELIRYVELKEYDGNETTFINFDSAKAELLDQIMTKDRIDDIDKQKWERINFINQHLDEEDPMTEK